MEKQNVTSTNFCDKLKHRRKCESTKDRHECSISNTVPTRYALSITERISVNMTGVAN